MKPFTFEELIQRESKNDLVWVIYTVDGEQKSGWGTTRTSLEWAVSLGGTTFLHRDDYGKTWLAYEHSFKEA